MTHLTIDVEELVVMEFFNRMSGHEFIHWEVFETIGSKIFKALIGSGEVNNYFK